MRDITGKEIKEGDILKCGDDALQYGRWSETIQGWAMSFSTGATTNIPVNCEIVGNIKNNPEMVR